LLIRPLKNIVVYSHDPQIRKNIEDLEIYIKDVLNVRVVETKDSTGLCSFYVYIYLIKVL
jgi:hypothetical protein